METGEATLSVVHNGNINDALGVGKNVSLAQRLLDNGFKPAALRTNDVFHIDQWKAMDDVVLEEAMLRLRGVADLQRMGLEYNMRNVGLGKTVLQWESSGDISDAEITMDAVERARQDQITYSNNTLPLYITHKDVKFSAREIATARLDGRAVDTENIQLAARKVAELLEKMLSLGPVEDVRVPSIWGTSRAYGYTTAPNRVTGSLAHTWTSGSATPATIAADVTAMKAALVAKRMFGPYILYVPTAYDVVLDQDYTSAVNAVTGTIRDRLLKFDGILEIRVADFMPADTVLMIQMTRSVVDLVVSQDPIIVPWQDMGGLQFHFKVMACMVPRMKNTQALRSGIAHYTGS